MADLEKAMEALRRADAEGNVEDARRLAAVVSKLKSATPEKQGFGATDYGQSFAGGINRGLVSMAGAPVDLVNWALSKAGLGSERPFLGSRQLREDVFESTETGQGMIAPGATDRLGRVLGRAGEEVGASAIPAAGIMGAATRGAAPAARSIWGAFANPIRQSPAQAATGELAAATGAGVGAGVAQEVAPESQLAETTGQIVGGFAPTALATMPAGLATRAAVGAVRRVSPAAQRKAGQEAVSDMLGEQLTPEVGAGLSEADRLRQRMPGFEPSLGEATGSPALLAQQQRVEDLASGRNLEGLVQRKAGSEAAVGKFSEQRAPGAEGSPEFIVDSATRSLDDMTAGITREAAGVEEGARSVAAAAPAADRAAAGQTLRDKLIESRTQTRLQLDARASELGIDQVDLTVPFSKFRKELASDLKPRSVFEDTSNYPSILDDLRGMDKDTVTFQDVKALRERLSDDLTDAMSGATPNRKKVRVLTLMKSRLDGFINDLDGEFGQAADSWRTFRQEYFDQYIDRFENGVAFKVRQKDGRGFYRTPDEKVAALFFEPGNTSGARQFRKVYGTDQEANAALEAVALDSLRQTAVRDGVVKPGLLQGWMRRHESVLKEYPAVRQAVDDVFKAQASVDARQAQIAARERQIGDMVLARELQVYGRGLKTAEQVVLDSALLRDPRRMQQLKTFLKDKPEAVQALQRQWWKIISQQDAAGITDTLLQNAESLKKLYSPQHLRDMQDVALAKAMLERTQTPRGTADVPRPGAALEAIVGQGLPQLGSRIFAFKSGRMQKGYLAVDTALRGLRGRAAISADELLRQALYDPELARDLAGAIRAGQLSPERANRLQARLFALGVPLLEEEQ